MKKLVLLLISMMIFMMLGCSPEAVDTYKESLNITSSYQTNADGTISYVSLNSNFAEDCTYLEIFNSEMSDKSYINNITPSDSAFITYHSNAVPLLINSKFPGITWYVVRGATAQDETIGYWMFTHGADPLWQEKGNATAIAGKLVDLGLLIGDLEADPFSGEYGTFEPDNPDMFTPALTKYPLVYDRLTDDHNSTDSESGFYLTWDKEALYIRIERADSETAPDTDLVPGIDSDAVRGNMRGWNYTMNGDTVIYNPDKPSIYMSDSVEFFVDENADGQSMDIKGRKYSDICVPPYYMADEGQYTVTLPYNFETAYVDNNWFTSTTDAPNREEEIPLWSFPRTEKVGSDEIQADGDLFTENKHLGAGETSDVKRFEVVSFGAKKYDYAGTDGTEDGVKWILVLKYKWQSPRDMDNPGRIAFDIVTSDWDVKNEDVSQTTDYRNSILQWSCVENWAWISPQQWGIVELQ